jgi:hypothetical protein
MKIMTSTAFALFLAAAGPAFAATTTNNTTPANTPNAQGQTNPTSQTGANLRQQVQNDLSKAGFTDIKVMPESFLVQRFLNSTHIIRPR